MTEIIADGGCGCGALRYSLKSTLHWSGYCHCESCRNYSSSPLVAYINIDESSIMFYGDTLSTYNSSVGVERGFCSRCGTPISYSTDKRPGEIQLYTTTLDFPEKIIPQSHVHWEERLPWLEIDDDLKKYNKGEIDG